MPDIIEVLPASELFLVMGAQIRAAAIPLFHGDGISPRPTWSQAAAPPCNQRIHPGNEVPEASLQIVNVFGISMKLA